MTNDELFSQLLDKISSFDYIHADQIPNIDLYMDQVTTFMDTHLGATRRYDEDKVLTKTMINNYAKNNLLPSPVRKKYTENHILQLILIYYMKSFLSISDIETMLKPLTQHFWDENSSPNFAEIYSKIFSYADNGIKPLADDLRYKFETSKETFSCDDDEQDSYLQLFTFLCMTIYDIYMKKQVVTGIIDELKRRQDASDERAKAAEKEKREERKRK